MLKWLIVALAVVAALLFIRITSISSRNLPKAGQAAPDFELPDQHGRSRSRAEFRGHWLVLYFYPRDDTPG